MSKLKDKTKELLKINGYICTKRALIYYLHEENKLNKEVINNENISCLHGKEFINAVYRNFSIRKLEYII
jgi:hypothetical protein